jgi:uncharacterized protein YcnI
MSLIRNTSLAVAASCCAVTAQAHVHLEYAVAPAGSSYKASFQVGHGCGASPTRQFIVEIPPGVRSARPMPKPGWLLEVRREPLPQPVSHQGRTVSEEVTRITWTARGPGDMLASNHYDEFVLVATLPQQSGPMYWPVRQVCEEGRLDWVEVPAPARPGVELKAPAPKLEVLPSWPAAGHRH